MAEAVVWAHDYALRAGSPAFGAAGADAPGVFVFDKEWIEREGLSLKRLVFLYECALEAGVSIRRGCVASAVGEFARAQGAGRVVTTWAPAPRIARQIEALEREFRVEVVAEEAFVDLGERGADLRRFSRYWSRAEGRVLAGVDGERAGRLFGGGSSTRE